MIEIALTVDDLPRHGDIVGPWTYLEVSKKMLETFRQNSLPPICGFVNAISLEANPADIMILENWLDAGNHLGNHTYSHLDIRNVTSKRFISDISKNEKILEQLQKKFLSLDQRYFRYPFLLEGDTEEKFCKVKDFLDCNDYKAAQVTIDYLDFLWNKPVCDCIANNRVEALGKLRKLYVEAAIFRLNFSVKMSYKIFQRNIRHVLLVHFGIATALFLKDVIQAYRKMGCNFIDLDMALSDDVYNSHPVLITSKGYNFLIRMARLKNIDFIWPNIDPEKIKQITDDF